MKFKAKYKPELICSKDAVRPVLHNAQVVEMEGRHKMVATDGRRLVVIPVECEESEKGPIPTKALKFARQARVSKQTDTVVMGVNGSISFENGWTMPRPSGDLKFPEVQQVIPKEPPSIRIALNTKMLYELAQAIGDDVVVLNITRPHDAIKVTVERDEAFGVIMPVRLP